MTNFSFSTLFILLLSSLGHAEVQLSDRVNDCGDYLVSGVVRIKPEGMQIIVHEKTKSEQTISLKLGDQSAAAVYLDKPMTIGLLLDTPFDGTKAHASRITKKAEKRIPNPLFPSQDTGYQLLKKSECKSK